MKLFVRLYVSYKSFKLLVRMGYCLHSLKKKKDILCEKMIGSIGPTQLLTIQPKQKIKWPSLKLFSPFIFFPFTILVMNHWTKKKVILCYFTLFQNIPAFKIMPCVGDPNSMERAVRINRCKYIWKITEKIKLSFLCLLSFHFSKFE